MIGQHAPTSDVERLVQRIARLEERVADLQRAQKPNPLGPLGEMAYDTVTGGVGGGTTTILTGSSFTVASGRRLKITITWDHAIQSGSGTTSQVQIWDGSTQLNQVQFTAGVAGTFAGGSLCVVHTPSAGSVQYRLRTFTNATSVSLPGKNTILVEDIGPA